MIVLAKVLGWDCVVKKTEFNVGDKCVYFEIDSLLPIAPWNDFLRKDPTKPARIKSIRLKSKLSQGLAMPISILPEGNYEVGQDVTLLLGVTKYEPYVSAELAGKVKGNFPAWLHKTDEIRLQSEPEVLAEAIKLGLVIVGTIKMDGTSFTAYLRDGEFGVCSRNLDLKETEDNAHWKIARKLKLEEILCSEGRNISVQGELVGPGVQSNHIGLKEIELHLFNLFDIDSGKFAGYNELVEFGKKHNLSVVKLAHKIDLTMEPKSLDDMLQLANDLNYGNGTPAEGIVWRPICETYSEVLKGRMSWKTISNLYLEKYKE